MSCPHQHSEMLPPRVSQGCQEPNPSAASPSPHGNLALVLCLVLNKNFAPNFVSLG